MIDEVKEILRIVRKQESGPQQLPNDVDEVLIEDQTSGEEVAD